jgi:hypothetical protein
MESDMKMRMWMAVAILGAAPWATSASVVTYHNSNQRTGAYALPTLTIAAAANMRRDSRFDGTISGHVYAQPLFWQPKGAKNGLVIVATESNSVYALDDKTGKVVWKTQLAPSEPLSDLPCGNIDPMGITGTPVIDPETGVLYLDAMTKTGNGARHMAYALSLADGSVVSGWPLDIQAALANQGVSFNSAVQGERSALLLFRNNLYINYGGHFGDCGNYRGTVLQLKTDPPAILASWQTRATGGGIWAQGGIAGDGQSLFVTTGNTFGASDWSDGEAIIRLKPGLAHSTDPKDYFAPSNWKSLDDSDQDLGGTEALPLNVDARHGHPAKRVIAFGKDGNAYLVDRSNLGGIGGQIQTLKVSSSAIRTAPAIYETADATMVAFANSNGGGCSGANITMLNVAAKGSSPVTVAWCAAINGGGAPIVTTTDGVSNAIVWAAGAEGDNELHGFNALNGQVVFSGDGTSMSGLHHFQTVLATKKRFYVAGDNKVYAFRWD